MAIHSKHGAPHKQNTTMKRGGSLKSSRPSFLQSLVNGKRKFAVVGVSLVLFGGVGTYMLRPSSADTMSSTGCREYSIADIGTSHLCVKYLQRMLNGTNYKSSDGVVSYEFSQGGLLAVDGYYGEPTKAAVTGYQMSTANNATPLVVNGVATSRTWAEVCYRTRVYYQSYQATHPLVVDGYSAGVSAGCQGTGWPTPTTTTVSAAAPVSTTNYSNQITSCYGYRTLNGATKLHVGVDIAGTSSRQPIYAVRKGVVRQVATSSGKGLFVVIRHTSGDGYDSWYQHLSAERVSVGQTVNAGQQIGNMGNTGNSYGDHLHLRLTKSTANNGTPVETAYIGDAATANRIHTQYAQYTKLGGKNCGL